MVSDVEEGWRFWPEDADEDVDRDVRRNLGESKKGVITVTICSHTCCSMTEESRATD